MKTGFYAHLIMGLLSLAILILAGLSQFLSVDILLFASSAFIIGSVLPDVDSPLSIPRKIVRSIIFITVIALIFIFYNRIVSACQSIIKNAYCSYTPLFAVFAPFLVLTVLDVMFPKHRGFLHSFSAAMLYGIVILFILGNFNFGLVNSLIISLFGGIGYIIHILVDFFGDKLPL